MFPFTDFESPKHAGLKREIAPLAAGARAGLVAYADDDDHVHAFFRSPENFPEFPLWHELGRNEAAHSEVMLELAREAILDNPAGVVWPGYLRVAGSARLGDFKMERFDADYSGRRLLEAAADGKNPEPMMRVALGIRRHEPFPSWEEIARRVSPRPESRAAQWLRAYGEGYGRMGNLFAREAGHEPWRPTATGWWVALAAVLTLAARWRGSLLPIVLMSASYLAGVYIVGGEHTRYFAPVWPVVILLLPVPVEAAMDLVKRRGRDSARG